jgi:hypothetical protein
LHCGGRRVELDMATPVSLQAPWATETDTTLEQRKNARRQQHRQAHPPALHAPPAKGESFFSVGGLGRAIPPPLHAPPPDSQLQRHQEWQHSMADAVAAVQNTARTKARGGARAIIFDFDKTLAATDVGTHLLSGGSAQIVDRVFGGAARLKIHGHTQHTQTHTHKHNKDTHHRHTHTHTNTTQLLLTSSRGKQGSQCSRIF